MIFVTGHLGFVGTHLCRAIKDEPFVGIDLKRGEDVLTCDLPGGVDRVYHLAAQTDAQTTNVVGDARINILGTLRLLQRYGDRVVLASTSAVNYPVSPYAISKLAAECYARLHGAAVVRLCNLYGEGGHGVIDEFRRADRLMIRGDGGQVRTYADVSSAVAALLAARPGDNIVLRGSDLSVNDIAKTMFSDKPIDRVQSSKFDLQNMVQR